MICTDAPECECLESGFLKTQGKLINIIRHRLDRRLRGRIDPDDILQDVYLEAIQRQAKGTSPQFLPLAIWLRLLTEQRISIIHRQHLRVKKRSVSREQLLSCSNESIDLASTVNTSPARCDPGPGDRAILREQVSQIQVALDRMNDGDKQVLSLRHLDGLSNGQIAMQLGLSKAAASKRYITAIRRLREQLGLNFAKS